MAWTVSHFGGVRRGDGVCEAGGRGPAPRLAARAQREAGRPGPGSPTGPGARPGRPQSMARARATFMAL